MLSELIFGKNLTEIALDDLQNFFKEEQEETSLLEFKSGGVSVDDIYKEVCAFLNTEGGIIIIGTPREEKKKPTPKTEVTICKGELIPSSFRGKDWLMTSIVSNISPPPTNLKIQEFHSENGSYFIVEVPQSITPPHQSNRDSRYYIRMEREAKPAPHGVVEALFFRRQKANLRCRIEISKPEDFKTDTLDMKIDIYNDSSFPTEMISSLIEVVNISSLKSVGLNNYETDIMTKGYDIFTDSNTVNSVIWKDFGPTYRYKLTPIYRKSAMPFVVRISYWSRDVEVKFKIYVFDPDIFEFIQEEDVEGMNEEQSKNYLEKVILYVREVTNPSIEG